MTFTRGKLRKRLSWKAKMKVKIVCLSIKSALFCVHAHTCAHTCTHIQTDTDDAHAARLGQCSDGTHRRSDWYTQEAAVWHWAASGPFPVPDIFTITPELLENTKDHVDFHTLSSVALENVLQSVSPKLALNLVSNPASPQRPQGSS